MMQVVATAAKEHLPVIMFANENLPNCHPIQLREANTRATSYVSQYVSVVIYDVRVVKLVNHMKNN